MRLSIAPYVRLWRKCVSHTERRDWNFCCRDSSGAWLAVHSDIAAIQSTHVRDSRQRARRARTQFVSESSRGPEPLFKCSSRHRRYKNDYLERGTRPYVGALAFFFLFFLLNLRGAVYTSVEGPAMRFWRAAEERAGTRYSRSGVPRRHPSRYNAR